MATIIAHQILSPLGLSSEETYEAVRTGRSALQRYDGRWGLPFPFVASLFTDAQWAQLCLDGYTRFESLCIQAIRGALAKTQRKAEGDGCLSFDVASPRTLLVVSTTKGNIECLHHTDEIVENNEYAGQAAERIARAVGITTKPIVVCNACISGLHALIVAVRLLRLGRYDQAVVVGADVQGPFIISGFQSLKALSPEPCRPFDMERLGLNLGEAAGAMILQAPTDRESSPDLSQGGEDGMFGNTWQLTVGAVTNDAYHISAPAKKGNGALAALEKVTDGIDKNGIFFINAHGTATMFNDQMESVAIERAGLTDVPVNSLKGYLGHTMGAAGIVETILSMLSADDGIVLPTRGFEELGVSGKMVVSSQFSVFSSQASAFIKMLSGFGGCNAAALWTKGGGRFQTLDTKKPPVSSMGYTTKRHVILRPDRLCIDGKERRLDGPHAEQLTHLYKQYVGDYPKYYKMDPLSRLGFIAAELLLNAECGMRNAERGRRNAEGGMRNAEGGQTTENCKLTTENCAIALCNHSSSIVSDRRFLETISDPEAFYPSPSVFVYTLPNIVTGEIAIKHHFTAETAFYLLPRRDEEQMDDLFCATLLDPTVDTLLCGWLDYVDADHYEADLRLIYRNNKE